MDNSAGDLWRAARWRRLGMLGPLLLIVGFVIAVIGGSPARANPATLGQATPSQCTPPTNPYHPSTTVASCETTTSTPEATVTLSISYQSGHVKWRSCVGAVAAGDTVQLFINGDQVDSSQVSGSGCTPDNNLSLCLAPGTYNATAVDQKYGQATRSFTVSESGCNNPTTLSASAGNSGGGSSESGSNAAAANGQHGFLAFTGANIALLVLGAGIVIAVGYALLRTSRRGRRTI